MINVPRDNVYFYNKRESNNKYDGASILHKCPGSFKPQEIFFHTTITNFEDTFFEDIFWADIKSGGYDYYDLYNPKYNNTIRVDFDGFQNIQKRK